MKLGGHFAAAVFRLFGARQAVAIAPVKAWRVDRDGNVILPTRRIVLKASPPSQGPTT